LLEGLEVIFIVVALGGLKSIGAASAGAVAALATTVVLATALRAPLTRVPENTMKYVVGLMLSAFGTFFAGEGIGVHWWHSDLSILILIAAYGLVSATLGYFLKAPPHIPRTPMLRVPRAVVAELWGLFVGEGGLATATLAVVLGIAVFVDRIGHRDLAAWLFAGGVILAVVVALTDSFRHAVVATASSETTVSINETAALHQESAVVTTYVE
jgi:hypothetical protein